MIPPLTGSRNFFGKLGYSFFNEEKRLIHGTGWNPPDEAGWQRLKRFKPMAMPLTTP
jgi:hypothetical protein